MLVFVGEHGSEGVMRRLRCDKLVRMLCVLDLFSEVLDVGLHTSEATPYVMFVDEERVRGMLKVLYDSVSAHAGATDLDWPLCNITK